MAIALASTICFSPLMKVTSTLPGPRCARCRGMVDLVLLQQEGDAVDIALQPLILEGEHGGEVEPGVTLMPMAAKPWAASA